MIKIISANRRYNNVSRCLLTVIHLGSLLLVHRVAQTTVHQIIKSIQSSLKIMNALFWYAAPWNELPIELSERRQIASFTFTSYHIW